MAYMYIQTGNNLTLHVCKTLPGICRQLPACHLSLCGCMITPARASYVGLASNAYETSSDNQTDSGGCGYGCEYEYQELGIRYGLMEALKC